MTAAARLAVRRPVATLALWAVVVGVLAVAGRHVDDRLTQSTLQVPGTESTIAIENYREQFGDQITIPVLLEGPPEALDRQGPRVARALERQDGVRVLSAWDQSRGSNPLRPGRRTALLLPAVEGGLDEVTRTGGPRVRAIVEEYTDAPVRARVTGMIAIGEDLKRASIDAGRQAERIALPVLMIVLLLVFRSLVAAAIPAIFGVAAVASGAGVLSLLASVMPLSEIATSLASMMGLALGVDYSLLMVARFREELANGADSAAAAQTAAATAGRTVLFAGIALLAAMAVAVALSPGDLLVSAAIGVSSVTVLSVVGAFTAVPAALALLGSGVNRWRLGRAPVAGAGAGAWAAERLLRRPLAGLVALVALLALAAPSMALDTGPPDVRSLPADSRARADFEALRRAMGPGWAATFDVVVVTRKGPLTTRRRLEQLERWQRRVARVPGVADVIGPGVLAPQSERVERQERRLARTQRRLRAGRRDAARLERGLGQAVGGVEELRGGLATAGDVAARIRTGSLKGADGAAQLAGAIDQASDGATRLGDGLATARRGAARIAAALSTTSDGAGKLEDALTKLRTEVSSRAAPGARELADGLRTGQKGIVQLAEPATTAQQEADRAYKELLAMTVGKADPRYTAALTAVARSRAAITGRHPITGQRVDPRYPGLPEALREAGGKLGQAAGGADELAKGLDELARALGTLAGGAGRLERGLARLESGQRRIAGGLRAAEQGTGRLGGGLDRLSDGAARLDAGLTKLGDGAGRLRAGLDRGARESGRLESGLDKARSGVARQRRSTAGVDGGGFGGPGSRTPGLFDSGYFLLAAIDGSRPADAKRAEYAVNVERGGRAGRIVVVPETDANDPRTQALRDRLSREADALGAELGAAAHVGGTAGLLADYDRETTERFPLLVAALALVTFLVLIPVFRALLLPAIGVALNLVTVGASFGVLAVLFQGSDPVLGGPGYVDAVSVTAMFTVIFGLSIDYQVFLIARMREAWLATGDPDAAITHGLRHTARVVTGAAAIMTGVFAAFSLTDVANVRQFGVGLAVAIVIDATIVRLLLLPALMRLGGRWTWWLPRWLERALPELDVEGSAGAGQAIAGGLAAQGRSASS